MLEPTTRKKRILLFSDGTGNSSGKLNKTNVWRMYEAADFGIPEDANEIIQIGRYDDGIGTTAFRPLALMQGIFGFGLGHNVRALYLFLCQNYRPGDEVCLFGFSRGAFTVRVLAGLIDRQGILAAENGEDLPALVGRAYRVNRRIEPPMWPMRGVVWLFKRAQLGVDTLLRRMKGVKPFHQVPRHDGVVTFMGVWDTVDAYGGPSIEVIRAIDTWIARISFKNLDLPECVRVARHALALDEERDAFQPRPWAETPDTSRDRLTQVWFPGVHSDVGGGYPEQGLAYVSLCWMMEHALERGIRLKPQHIVDALEARDASGRMHDSRAGLAGYYRYQPRNVGTYITPPQPGTESELDPKQPDDQGLRTPVLIHESVFQRMVFGTDRYAPISIGVRFRIVSDRLAVVDGAPVSRLQSSSVLPPEARERLGRAMLQDSFIQARAAVLDHVWMRRFAYFALAIASLTLVTLPLWQGWVPGAERRQGIVHLLELPFVAIESFMPAILSGWIETVASWPMTVIGLGVLIVAMLIWSTALERRLRARSRHLWNAVLEGTPIRSKPPGPIQRLRTSSTYQGWFTAMKWGLLPSLLGIGMLACLLAAALGLLVQARLSLDGAAVTGCPAASDAAGVLDGRRSCTTLPVRVEAARTYTLLLAFPKPDGWPDKERIPRTAGVGAGQSSLYGLDAGAIGMRRLVEVPWLQPIAYVHDARNDPAALPASWEADEILPVTMRYAGRSGDRVFYSGTFRPSYSGPIGLGLNDAVLPWPFPAHAAFRGRWLHGASAYPALADRGAEIGLWVDSGGPPGTAHTLMTSERIHCWTARASPAPCTGRNPGDP